MAHTTIEQEGMHASSTRKGVREDDAAVVRAAGGEGVADDGPLRLRAERRVRQHLAEVVDEADQVEPVLLQCT